MYASRAWEGEFPNVSTTSEELAMSSPHQGPGYRAFLTHIDTLMTAITDPNGSHVWHTHTFVPSSADTFLTYHSVQTSPPSPLELYVSYFKDVYKNDPLPTYDKWPQVKGKKFINLSLLSKCNVSSQEAHKYTKAMFHGHVSSITLEKMKMADIAKTEDGSITKGRRRCILVEGAPGVGKSTFAWKLCQQWSKGRVLQQYRLVVLLRLREKRVRETKAASDLFR